jgi:hypothetical protein
VWLFCNTNIKKGVVGFSAAPFLRSENGYFLAFRNDTQKMKK